MKPILGVAVLLTWFTRCPEVDLPHGHHHGHGHPQAGAGAEQEPDAGDDAAIAIDAGEPAPPVPCDGPPGLYVEHSCDQLATGVRHYEPLYELWSDGATKDRFIFLPEGKQIDVANPDRWTFPLGTRLYKTFSVEGRRIETRVIEKIKDEPGVESWTFLAYRWSDDELSVSAADPAGESNVLGTQHDIPSQTQCKGCHTMTTSVPTTITDATTGAVTTAAVTKNQDAVNGFGAIQLNHPDAGAGVTLRDLKLRGVFFNSTGGPGVDVDAAHIPGDAKAQAALGYLHANCAQCHGGASPRAGLNMTAKVGMTTLDDAPTVKTGVCACLGRWTGRSNPDGQPYVRRAVSGHSEISGIVGRMSVRGAGEQMPPLGTEVVDDVGLAAVSDWIDSLDPTACDARPACPPPMPPAAATPPAATPPVTPPAMTPAPQ